MMHFKVFCGPNFYYFRCSLLHKNLTLLELFYGKKCDIPTVALWHIDLNLLLAFIFAQISLGLVRFQYKHTGILWLSPGRVVQSVGHLTRKSGVLGSIPGLATYFRFSFRFFKKGSYQLTDESMCTK